MSDESGPEVTNENVAPLSLGRILVLMAAVIVLGSVVSAVTAGFGFALGVLLGGAVSFANYFWLKRSLTEIFERIIRDGEKPRFLSGAYVFRYLALGGVIAVVLLTDAVPFTAFVLGLASLAFAVMIEGFIQVFTIVFIRRES
jgi:hypothetical protein